MVCSRGLWCDNLWFTGLREFLATFLALATLASPLDPRYRWPRTVRSKPVKPRFRFPQRASRVPPFQQTSDNLKLCISADIYAEYEEVIHRPIQAE